MDKKTNQTQVGNSNPKPPCNSDEEFRCNTVNDYYGDMICLCVNQSGKR